MQKPRAEDGAGLGLVLAGDTVFPEKTLCVCARDDGVPSYET